MFESLLKVACSNRLERGQDKEKKKPEANAFVAAAEIEAIEDFFIRNDRKKHRKNTQYGTILF